MGTNSKLHEVTLAIDEAERFLKKANIVKTILLQDQKDEEYYSNGNGRANGAMKRASLDLSAALVRLRRDF